MSKMVVIAKDREMKASVDRVWEALTDWGNERKYWTNVRDINVLKTDGVTIEREATVGPRGFAQKTKQTIVLQTQKSITLSFDGEGIAGERTILLVPIAGDKTKVDVAWSLQLRNVPGFVEGIVRNQISKATEEALKKIADTAERQQSRSP